MYSENAKRRIKRFLKMRNNNRNKSALEKRMGILFFLMAFVITAIFVSVSFLMDLEQKKELEQLQDIEKLEVKIQKEGDKKQNGNSDWIGWVKIHGTTFSYPIMQRPSDPEYYLHRDFEGRYSFVGTPFMDERCSFTSDNCIIYGHNINGGRYFGLLRSYLDPSYYKSHPTVLIRQGAGEQEKKYHIVSIMETDIHCPTYRFTEVGNWTEYVANIKYVLSHSKYSTEAGKKLQKMCQDKSEEEIFKQISFVTLSTCRSWIGHDARLLIVAAQI